MRMVVTDLTRMYKGHVCVAGVDLDTTRRVRPVLSRGGLTAGALLRNGGPFDMAEVVELGRTFRSPKAPHVEDEVFDPLYAQGRGAMDARAFWRALYCVSRYRLEDVFGPALEHAGRGRHATAEGTGVASLGCFLPKKRPHVYVSSEGRIRVRFTDGAFDVDASVTDLRL